MGVEYKTEVVYCGAKWVKLFQLIFMAGLSLC
jgi:hypothetical protein